MQTPPDTQNGSMYIPHNRHSKREIKKYLLGQTLQKPVSTTKHRVLCWANTTLSPLSPKNIKHGDKNKGAAREVCALYIYNMNNHQTPNVHTAATNDVTRSNMRIVFRNSKPFNLHHRARTRNLFGPSLALSLKLKLTKKKGAF